MIPRALVAGLTPPTLLMACALVASATTPDRVSSDGAWRELDLLRVYHPLTVHDPERNELLSIGGQRNECWAFPLAGSGEWQRLPAPTSPILIDDSWSDWDPATRRAYFLATGPGGTLEVRTLDPRTGEVATIPASGAPLFMGGTMVFDAERQRVIVCGVTYDQWFTRTGVWALDLQPTPAWSEWLPDGPPPPTHDYAVLDPGRRLLVQLTGTPEIYTLTLDGPPQWSSLLTSDPAPSVAGPIVFDAAGDRFWTISKDGQAYSLSLATLAWTPVQLPGPSPRVRPGIAIDAVGHRLFVHGGMEFFSRDILGSLSALSIEGAPSWTEIVREATRPRPLVGAGDAYDPVRRRLVLFGGVGNQSGAWALDLGATPRWSPLATGGRAPDVREGFAVAWNGNDLLVVGGWSEPGFARADAWGLNCALTPPVWYSLVILGPYPGARAFSQLVHDTRRNRFLLLQGINGQSFVDDIWELILGPEASWRRLHPAGTPPPSRFGAMAAYDPVHDRVIMFGGSDLNDVKGDLWALNLASGDGTWQELAVPSGPAPRCQGLMRLDTARNRLVLFGGYGGRSRLIGAVPGDEQLALNDAWALELDAMPSWRRLSPEGLLPFGRDRANGAYDPINDRLVVTCGGPIGTSYSLGSNDVWELSFSAAATPALIELASQDATVERVRLTWRGASPGEHATAYRRDPGAPWRSLGMLFADGDGTFTLVDPEVTPEATIQYRLGVTFNQGEVFVGSTTVRIPPVAASLSARAVNGRVSFTVVLPSHEPASLALFDLAGRRVWSASASDLGPGTHEVTTTTLRSALYFARLRQGGVSRFARVAVFQ